MTRRGLLLDISLSHAFLLPTACVLVVQVSWVVVTGQVSWAWRGGCCAAQLRSMW